MDFYNLFNFECLWRTENKPLQHSSNKKIIEKNKKVEFIDNLICSGCFCFVDSLDDYERRAIMLNNHYGFCCDDCYKQWLNPAFQKYLGKINKD
tara:strand:+ start:630 stop:911 length:282 start_codon:yes stop_codon:yes gene_type:complete